MDGASSSTPYQGDIAKFWDAAGRSVRREEVPACETTRLREEIRSDVVRSQRCAFARHARPIGGPRPGERSRYSDQSTRSRDVGS
jgi:hypothetical protein